MNTRKIPGIFLIVLAFAAFTFCLAVRAQAQTETVLYNFSGAADGSGPTAGLVADSAGNLYGVTQSGGQTTGNCSNNLGCGVVFELSPNGTGGWTETVLYTFTGGADGAFPAATLLLDTAGNLYGAAASGGNVTNKDCSPYGCGVVFELSPSSSGWTETVLYSFHFTDGLRPTFLIRDGSGNFYGTTLLGGSANSGTVFRLSPGTTGWVQSLLHTFTGGTGGYQPNGLVFGPAGSLYGTVAYGGVGDIPFCGFAGCGFVFKLASGTGGGWHETTLYTFTGGTDGGVPNGLVLDSSGRIYGSTLYGGTPPCGGKTGCGVVFRLISGVSGWRESVIYTFTGTNGKNPAANLFQDASGTLYGTTTEGGIKNSNCDASGCGLVFKLAPTSSGWWIPTTLHQFDYTDGAFPQSTPWLDSAGNLYGSTLYGGASGFGTVFEIQP
jgi:uncharacterized repeat protein (TIGR03803 family)